MAAATIVPTSALPSSLDLKICLIGAVGSGKTSLVLRYVKSSFRDYLETTIGASFLSKSISVRGIQTKLSLWDTAGQEEYRSVVSLYWRNASAIIVVYDISRKQTFIDAKQWIETLKLEAPPTALIALVGNKVDLQAQREVSTAEAEDYASEIDAAIFLEASAKSNVNVNSIFESICKKYIARLEREKSPSADVPKAAVVNLSKPTHNPASASASRPSPSSSAPQSSPLGNTQPKKSSCC